MKPRVAVIDIGSNSIKALVAGPGSGPGTLQSLYEETLEVRISTGIGAVAPVLRPERIAAATTAVRELLQTCRAHGPLKSVRIVATSAVRSAANGEAFLDAVEAATGCRPDILTGDEEALGIALGVRTDPAIAKQLNDFVVFDLGGGSLELIRFVAGEVVRHVSLPLGSVRLTEQLVEDAGRPLSGETQSALSAHVQTILQSSGFPLAGPLVGCGGGLSSLRAFFAREDGNAMAASSPVLPAARIIAAGQLFSRMGTQQRIATGIPAGRADIFPAAMITFRVLMELAAADQILHSFHNLRYGLAAESILQK